ncbi:MAG: DNA recombination protein RmuC [Bacteroidales bacterium]|nr:DNA recombination protein RmuC [Bacteroidales bacterium]
MELEHNVLITTEETLVPFLRLIHGAWVQKEQIENIEGIVKAAEEMINRVGIFCSANAALEKDLEDVLDGFKENTKRLVDGKQSIVKAAMKAIEHGVPAPSGKNALPPLSSTAYRYAFYSSSSNATLFFPSKIIFRTTSSDAAFTSVSIFN